MTKETCIEKVCNLPLDFKISGKSTLTLLYESNYYDLYNSLSQQDIKEYLLRNKDLINKWVIFSEDKRTSEGYYLMLDGEKHFVGSLEKIGKEPYAKSFTTKEEACAEFILLEIRRTLKIESDFV
ncbi:MAG: hypothetical protein K9H61_07640 [Bacteroidia bacterium]|nr:hypothetical protein [Bacteroidia bacterium]MCF8428299.1 hypothetical protein [Bacteroidia bacterium]MCF8446853.1 hypothetical protein [Bacteroidia bacterium]